MYIAIIEINSNIGYLVISFWFNKNRLLDLFNININRKDINY